MKRTVITVSLGVKLSDTFTMISKHKPDEGLQELKRFIETAKLDASALRDIDAETKVLYRKFYALLVFDHLLQGSLSDAIQKNYARETVSDLSHGFFLTCIGLYKPARTSARSAIENLIRFLLLHRGVDAMSITAVYALFEEANRTFLADEEQFKRIGRLRSVYSELCKTVHSSSADYMNLEVPFNTMLTFDKGKFSDNRDIVRECCTIVGELLFVEFDSLVQSAHYTHRDILSESVSKSVRREARSSRTI
ncbi:hypothetical protein [Sulfitobacter sp. R18_1]|uniref:hypothetical protein n=1 Tax=Sulfitobacter sp. R18_1 TaxID=2821104 RepID=UPI001ADBFC8E|nr:hypothetical protein [Sulfitobacter sp. R18_1]MBO9429681.1 hypothetical protein [Sulfitobacter sp. R18_1]